MIRTVLRLSVAALALVVLAPVMVVLAALIRAETPGSPLFLQRRVGRGGAVFLCCKLRTMALDTPEGATHLTPDHHVTRMGRFLRRTRLDEVPQLWNVLKGEMAIVGPRPCLPSQTDLVALRRAAGVLDVRPGITGLAQVQGIDMSRPERLTRYDRLYVENRSARLDARIVGATLSGILGRPAPALPHPIPDE